MKKHKHLVLDFDGTLFDAYISRRPYDDAESVMRILHAHPFASLSLLTAGDYIMQRRKIDESGLGDFFEQIEVVREKPEKQAALKKFVPGRGIVDGSLDPKDVIVVGDRIEFEIAYGRKLGFTTVQILRGPHRHRQPASPLERADFKISSLNELIPLFPSLATVSQTAPL